MRAIVVALLLVACADNDKAEVVEVIEAPEAAPPVPTPRPTPRPAPPPAATTPKLEWLKGNLHTHTHRSPDSGTSVAEVVRWYETEGYDFVVLTDHNHVTHGEGSSLIVIPGVELTHKTKECDPPPPDPAKDCRIHVNALFVDREPGRVEWSARDVISRADKYQRAFEAARGLKGLAQINHPNWNWGVSGELVAELGRRGALLLEIHNQQFRGFDRGRPGKHPSTEDLWDAALTAGVTMWGVAVDDAHNYWEVPGRRERGEDPGYPAGGAFVMVRAARTVQAIRASIERGRFYASTGILLERFGREGDQYIVEVADGTPPYSFVFIGKGGEPLRSVRHERQAAFPIPERRGYLRIRVEDSAGNRAWTQPIRLP